MSSAPEELVPEELLADAHDLAGLREAVRAEGNAPTISLEELKAELGA